MTNIPQPFTIPELLGELNHLQHSAARRQRQAAFLHRLGMPGHAERLEVLAALDLEEAEQLREYLQEPTDGQ